MTWIQINPDKFSQYEGMTPADIGRSILSEHDYLTPEFMYAQERMHAAGTEPYLFPLDDPRWMEFWKVVYDLKDKPKESWTLDEWYAYRGISYVIPYARFQG
jgi:hypothetical protein